MTRIASLLRWSVLSLALVLSGGCARYKVTFTNQTTSTSHGKPRHNKADGTITFKDAKGNKQIVPAFAVESIEPY